MSHSFPVAIARTTANRPQCPPSDAARSSSSIVRSAFAAAGCWLIALGRVDSSEMRAKG